MKGRRILTLFLASLLALSLAACSKPSAPPTDDKKDPPAEQKDEPVAGGKLVYGTIGDAESLNPIYSADTASSDVAYLVQEGLIRANRKLEMECVLCDKYEFSGDGKTLTFTLKQGVKWHDGQPFTAKDVAFTYEAIMHPLYGGTRQSNYDKLVGFKEAKAKYDAIKKDQTDKKIEAAAAETQLIAAWEEWKKAGAIKVEGDHKISFTIAEPFAPFLANMGMGIIPQHLLKDVRPDKMKEHETNRKPVGTGPWKFVDWKKGDQIILESNKDYHGKAPLLSQFVYKIIPDQNAIAVALEDGSIDMGVITPELFDRFNNKPGFKIHEWMGLSYTYMGYNLRDPKFADVKVRQAITHAIDRKAIVDAILMGHGTQANSHGAPVRWDYNANVPVFDYNKDKAKQLLAEAGWKPGPDGILQKDGKPFKFTLQTNQNKVREQVITIVQQQLKEVGIQVETKVVEWSSFVSNNLLGQDFEVIVVGWSLGSDPDAFSIWHSSQANKGQFNFVGFIDKRTDEVIEQGRTELDMNKRKQLYGELQKVLAENQPYTFLFFPNELRVIRDAYKGDIQGAPNGIFYNLNEWYLPKGKQ